MKLATGLPVLAVHCSLSLDAAKPAPTIDTENIALAVYVWVPSPPTPPPPSYQPNGI